MNKSKEANILDFPGVRPEPAPTDPPGFSIAIVNYKTLELTKLCLEQIKSHFDSGRLDRTHVDIWVLDNHSADESVEYLRSIEWINLLERPEEIPGESGAEAHGRGLDVILEHVRTRYMFIMHTDTFVRDASVFDQLLSRMETYRHFAAVGCLHQIDRGRVRLFWRTLTRFFKYHSRRFRRFIGLPCRAPQYYRETNIKSFFALWDARLLKSSGYGFWMNDHTPTYEAQRRLRDDGFEIATIPPAKLFRYLDHCEGGILAQRKTYGDDHRRLKRKKRILNTVSPSIG